LKVIGSPRLTPLRMILMSFSFEKSFSPPATPRLEHRQLLVLQLHGAGMVDFAGDDHGPVSTTMTVTTGLFVKSSAGT
jgi:hypothetical protein